jgi:hypothetical protein
MKKTVYSISAIAAMILAGCGSASNTTSATTDIVVERGPMLYANVTDANGQRATMQGNGLYRFETAPAYPVISYGGIIDMNRNNMVDEGDVIASRLRLITSEGDAATIVSSLAVNESLLAMLQEEFGLDKKEIFNETPSTDKRIAAISDEVYKYCIENSIDDPSTLTLQQIEAIKAQINERIRSYENSSQDAGALERILMQNELAVEAVTQTQAQNINEHAQESGGYVSVPYGYNHGAENGNGGSSSSAASSNGNSNQYGNIGGGISASSSSQGSSITPVSELSEEQKYALAFMWNEEKLAKDIYLALNDTWANQTFYNIATRGETQHEAAVEALVQKYDINITNLSDYEESYSEAELRAFAPGKYAISKIQDLYDALYAKGVRSAQEAIEVGCMVEVTDVNDLNEHIEASEGVDDLITTFEHLRSGSYSHYWAFDGVLKSMGVTDGCCSLGDDFCKTEQEYPTGNGGNGGNGNGGNGKKGGR